MARTIKSGLDYFSFDVDFFNDDKIELISSEFGLKGELIAIRLLCHIYRNGYYYTWGKDESLLFAKRVGNGITGTLVNEVVEGLIKRSFFDKRVFDSFSILTSKGIQKRYIDAKERSKNIELIKEFTLLSDDEALKHNNVTLISINVGNNPQRKGKKSKEEESKEFISAEAPEKKSFKQFTEKDFIDEISQFANEFPYELRNAFFKYWKERSPGGKMRFQLEKTWETELRLSNWKIRDDEKKLKNGTHLKTPSKNGRANIGKKAEGAARLAEELRDELGVNAG
jgi:hypothetical protein